MTASSTWGEVPAVRGGHGHGLLQGTCIPAEKASEHILAPVNGHAYEPGLPVFFRIKGSEKGRISKIHPETRPLYHFHFSYRQSRYVLPYPRIAQWSALHLIPAA